MKLKLVVGTLVLLILGYTVFGDYGLVKLVRDRKNAQALVEEARKIRQENEELKQEIERLKNDRGYQERLAREELGMVKPGEIVYSFPQSENSADKP